MDQRTRKSIIMYKDLHLRDDIDGMCQEKVEVWLANIEDYVDITIRGLIEYTKKRKKKLIITDRNINDNKRSNCKTINRKDKWYENQLNGYCKRQIWEIVHEKSWTWLRKGNLIREIESSGIAKKKKKNNSKQTNFIKTKTDDTKLNRTWRWCREKKWNG